jgi:hypothetical protein
MESEHPETDIGKPHQTQAEPPTPEKEKPRRNDTVHKLSAPLPRSPIKSSYDSPKKVSNKICLLNIIPLPEVGGLLISSANC